MAQAFFTYKVIANGNYNGDQLYGTQAAADADALLATDIFAYTGAQDVPDTWITGYIWDITKNEWREPAISDLSDTDQVINAARMVDEQLRNWTRETALLADNFSSSNVALVHNLIAYARRGIRGVVLSADWTALQKIKMCDEMASGPTDVKNAISFYLAVETTGTVPPDPYEETDKRVLWANPDTGSSVNLNAWKSAVESEGGTGTSALARMEDEPTDLSDYVNGEWINGIS